MSKTKVVIALIGLLTAIIGGGAAISFDFSSNSETNIGGDTIFNNLVDLDVIRDIGEDIAYDVVCGVEPIPDNYISLCEAWNDDG